MKLLISLTDEKEAAEAIAGGANIIDVKNPKEGSLGASFPWIIKRVKEMSPSDVEVSCTLGDVLHRPGAISLTALGAATTGVDYVKAGLQGVKNTKDAVYAMQKIIRSVKDYDSRIKVVAVGYADAQKVNSVNPMALPEIAHKAKLDVVMIDTAVKDRNNIFASLSMNQLSNFAERSHKYGLTVALAGSLSKDDLPRIKAVGADIVGLRGAACSNQDRVHGRLRQEAVRELADIMKNVEVKSDRLHIAQQLVKNTDRKFQTKSTF